MLEISKFYRSSRFSSETLKKAFEVFEAGINGAEMRTETLSITRGDTKYPYSKDEVDQFLIDRDKGDQFQWSRSVYVKPAGDYGLFVTASRSSCNVLVASTSEKHLRDVIAVFDREQAPIEATKSAPFTIFIGHGRNPAWRELKDHLHDLHNYSVEHYERISTAGFNVWDRLEMMLRSSTMAVLVLTGEDLAGDEKLALRARQNVIHELGLCQGRFGIHRALALVEEGIDLPSNLGGVDFIPFGSGNIKETFGLVLAAIRREFPNAY